MKIHPSIACCLLAAGLLGSAHASVQGIVIAESADGRSTELQQFNSRGVLVPAQQRGQTLVPGYGGLPDVSHPQKVLVLLIGPNYQAHPLAELQNLFEGSGPKSLKSFYESQSGGRLRFAPFVYRSIAQPGYNGCVLNVDSQLARYTEATGDRAIDFDHVFYMGSFDQSKCTGVFTGTIASASAGTIRVSNQYGSYEHTASSYSDEYMANEYILSHEFGHQLGWDHSNSSSTTQHFAYGDAGEVMGAPYGEYRVSAFRKWSYGWMESTRTLGETEYGSSIQISRRSGPELLMVPLPISRLKTQYMGRTMLAIAIEDEIPDQNGGLPWRRAGLLPRIVSTGLPFSATSVLIDPAFDGSTQKTSNLVIDRPGNYSLPEAGVTIVVEQVSRSSATLKIYNDLRPSPFSISMLPNPSGTACYHRVFAMHGIRTNALVTAQTQSDGARETMKQVGTSDIANYAWFLGAASMSVSAAEMNTDGSYTTYNATAPAARECTELPPVLQIEQTRLDETYGPECGLITTSATNLASPTTSIFGQLGANSWSFAGYDTWNLFGFDNRQIATTHWADSAFEIGTTTVAPVECFGRPVPKLQFAATSFSADCKTVSFKITQTAPGIAGSHMALTLGTFGPDGAKYQECAMGSESAGTTSCDLTFDSSLNLRRFTARAESPSDLAAMQGTFLCKASK
ncbi:MAG: hypothetical protein SGI99_08095 [Pseudomonadota bacterium]|nr:hypothetical protein [Pseudomonadota bacterium]